MTNGGHFKLRWKDCTVTDFEVPKRYGLRQTIGDTLGIGGIMRAVRTIPVLIMLADAQVAELGLLEIRVDPDITQRADRHEALTSLDVVAGIQELVQHLVRCEIV
jgi:hypothetical protein